MRRNKWPTAIDRGFSIGLESICYVVVPDAEENLKKFVSQPVEEELEARIVNDTASAHETAAKNAVVTFV